MSEIYLCFCLVACNITVLGIRSCSKRWNKKFRTYFVLIGGIAWNATTTWQLFVYPNHGIALGLQDYDQ